ncbi:Glyoxalase/Bleomycin resistance protein/Dihydroxybiphenyl dioxygenase [Aspergillus floccosus]
MIDHVAIFVPKGQLDTIADWYKRALRPLKYREIMRRPGAVGLGHEGIGLWLTEWEGTSVPKAHVALRAPDRPTVNDFHNAAVAADGVCNGAPGIRSEYHESYYATFVLDPLGNNIEVVDQRSHEEEFR